MEGLQNFMIQNLGHDRYQKWIEGLVDCWISQALVSDTSLDNCNQSDSNSTGFTSIQYPTSSLYSRRFKHSILTKYIGRYWVNQSECWTARKYGLIMDLQLNNVFILSKSTCSPTSLYGLNIDKIKKVSFGGDQKEGGIKSVSLILAYLTQYNKFCKKFKRRFLNLFRKHKIECCSSSSEEFNKYEKYSRKIHLTYQSVSVYLSNLTQPVYFIFGSMKEALEFLFILSILISKNISF